MLLIANFELISIKAQLLETAWSCLTCLYIMNIANIYCNLYVETYVGSQHVNILKCYLLDNNIQNLRLSSYFWNSWLDKSYSRRVASKLTIFLKNDHFHRKTLFYSKPVFSSQILFGTCCELKSNIWAELVFEKRNS